MNLPGIGEVSLAWAPSSEVDEGDAWLAPAEAAILGRFRVSKRAGDWRLGRWVAKEAVARALGGATAGSSRHPPAPHDIEILAGPGGGPRARVLAPGHWPDVAVSLSHSVGMGFAAAAAGGSVAVRIGCDIEAIAPRSDRFVSDYFTAGEAAWVRAAGEAAAPADQRPGAALGDHHVRATLLWSAKESVLKALGEGLRKDTRSVVVEVDGPSGLEPSGSPAAAGAVSADSAVPAWHPLTASAASRGSVAGWWRLADGLVWTVVGWKDEGAT